MNIHSLIDSISADGVEAFFTAIIGIASVFLTMKAYKIDKYKKNDFIYPHRLEFYGKFMSFFLDVAQKLNAQPENILSKWQNGEIDIQKWRNELTSFTRQSEMLFGKEVTLQLSQIGENLNNIFLTPYLGLGSKYNPNNEEHRKHFDNYQQAFNYIQCLRGENTLYNLFAKYLKIFE